MQDAAVPTAPDPDHITEQAARRRRPQERRVSRYTGLLMIVIITQAAFGYGLLNPAWQGGRLADAHVGTGILVLVMSLLLHRSVRALPEEGARARFLRALSSLLVSLVLVQATTGAFLRGWLPGQGIPLSGLHLALGLLAVAITVLLHFGAIAPSLIIGAQRELERDKAALAGRPDPYENQGAPDHDEALGAEEPRH